MPGTSHDDVNSITPRSKSRSSSGGRRSSIMSTRTHCEHYRAYPMRWIALFQLCAINTGNTAQWVVFGIVLDQAKTDFGLTTVTVNVLSACYEIVFCLAGPVALVLYDRFGLRDSLRRASVTNAIGGALRFVAVLFAPNFGMLLTSQIFLALSLLFVFPAPPILAARWFGETERTMATTIGAMSNSLGLALGQLIPPLIVTPDHHGTKRWILLFVVQCSYSLVEFFLIFFVVPRGPPTPPSAAEEVRLKQIELFDEHESLQQQRRPRAARESTPLLVGAASRSRSPGTDSASTAQEDTRRSSVFHDLEDRQGLVDTVCKLFRIKSFACLFAAAGIFFGCQWSIIGLLAQLLKPIGISEETVGWMGFTQIFVGIIAALPFSRWVDKIRRYQTPLAGLLIACTVLYNIFATVLVIEPEGMVPIAYAVYTMLGIPQACAIPVMFEYAVELTYPTDESTATMVIVWIANTATVPLMFILPAMLGDKPSKGAAQVALFSLAIMSSLSALLVILPRSVLRRYEYELACEDEEQATRKQLADALPADLRSPVA